MSDTSNTDPSGREPHYGRLWTKAQWADLQNIVNQGMQTAAKNNIYVGSRSSFEAACAKKYIAQWSSQLPKTDIVVLEPTELIPQPLGTAEDVNKVYATASKLVAKKRYSVSKKEDMDSTVSDDNYIWNLPPHVWSLPYRPHSAYPNYSKNPYYNGYANSALRRGRIRWRWASPITKYVDSLGNELGNNFPSNRMYGFQFIWNPEQFNTTTAINYNSTATAADQAVAAPGWYPGAQNIDITIRVDRTNDFACFRGRDISKVSLEELRKWYPERIPNEAIPASETYTKKLENLMAMGTMADIDYLYRTVNDITKVNNKLGQIITADAGYLAFNAVQFHLGPIGYIGFLTGISVNHIGFTEDYIPIRSDVTISARIMTNSTAIAGDAKSPIGNGGRTTGNLAGTGLTIKGPTVD